MATAERRVVVTQRYFDQATIDYLNENNCEVDIIDLPKGKADGNLTPDELKSLLAGARGWIVGHAHITRELLQDLPNLAVISRRGVGYERVDVIAVRDLGRVITIAAGGNDASVADHTIGLMLAVGRRLREMQNRMQAGDWTILVSSDLNRKTVGLIGLGRIGRSVVQRLKGFNCRILVNSPHPDADYARNENVTFCDVETILRESDYISLHAPLVAATRNLIDEKAIALMKPTAIVINTARGGLVDDCVLLQALKDGRLAGAGLDVYLSESDKSLADVTAELIALPNVVATPHSAASSLEGLARTNMVAARSVVAVLDGGDPPETCVIADGRTRPR
ncbi:phosphoglycerate dehydrogenase [Shinella sp. BYT-45]|uniref:phosphoglycerate dehydrogenase n=1 Tax=Shinella sp. BYT-45 TaxID=3377377 RepID=UPI003980F495